MLSLEGFWIVGVQEGEEGVVTKKKRNGGLQLKIKVSNPSLRRLISGAIAGAVPRTTMAPLETIKGRI
jgi:solute carrier family 25 phosphate transporter 23/24/25/41